MTGLKLAELLRPTIEGMGYRFWGCEQLQDGMPVLRVYIEHADGLTADACALVSRQLGSVLDVEDSFSGAYRLEVSSPGVERVLFTPEQYQEFVGQLIQVRLHDLIEGQRKWKGKIVAVTADHFTLQPEEHAAVVIPFTVIARANVVFEVTKGKKS